MAKNSRTIFFVVFVSVFLFFFVASEIINIPWLPEKSFRLGLDLLGGTHLIYQADLSRVDSVDRPEALEGIRDVVERRVNLFGVSEPVVQISGDDRLIVDLAGISDVNEAINLIGETPFLEFRTELSKERGNNILARYLGESGTITADLFCDPSNLAGLAQFIIQFNEDPCYESSGLSGSQIRSSAVIFDQSSLTPQVSLELNNEGKKLFAEITKNNLNKRIAIYLDGSPISAPVVQSEIVDGNAVISGNFSPEEAKLLSNRLNSGALPVPINLISQQSVGASLGHESLVKSLKAGIYGLVLVALFMVAYYRLPGLFAVLALIIYVLIVLAIYKALPVTLTLAGIAGFVLSLGMAVDANVLIFERMKEELNDGRTIYQAVTEGFDRAWLSVRDSHVTTLIGAFVLYISTTSVVKGFALTLGIGVLASLLTATVITKAFLNLATGPRFENKKWLFK